MLTVQGTPESVMAVSGNVSLDKPVEATKRATFNWKGFIFNVPVPDSTGMIPLSEIIPVLFLLMTTDSKEERNTIMKEAMMDLRDANGARYFPQ